MARSTPAVVASALLVALGPAACTYDFDAPFGEAGQGGASSTGGGAGTPASSGTGDGAGGPGGGPPGGEACDNGVDDDDDGAVDCADDACTGAGFACAPTVPEGFDGPVALVRATDGAAPACGGAFPDQVLQGGVGALHAPTATCSPCTCGSPDGGACTTSVALFADGSCLFPAQPASLGVVFTGASGCEDSPDPLAVGGARAAVPIVDGGACAPGGGVPSLEEASFDDAVALCARPAGEGCDGAACLPAVEAPFDGGLCVWREGAGGCAAAGPYSIAVELHRGVDDARGCTACTCGDPEGVTCDGTTTFYRNNDGCNGQSFTVEHDGQCRSADEFESYRSTLAPTGGACEPAGGEPEGDAFATDPVTVCCLP